MFRQAAFFPGRALAVDGVKDLAWFGAGRPGADATATGSTRTVATLGMYLDGQGIRTRGPRGERVVDDSFLLLLHAGAARRRGARCPGAPWATSYEVVLDTAERLAVGSEVSGALRACSRSVVLLRADRPAGPAAPTATARPTGR